VDNPVQQVELDGKTLAGYPTRAALDAAGIGWWQDGDDLSLVVAFPDHAPFALTMRYDPALSAPAPDVAMPFEVRVPAGTPHESAITIATSAGGWTHVPLAWTGADTAAATIVVPRGQWVFYKYARGAWDTVEKWPGCAEATNRYAFGAAHPVKADQVWGWADLCR
jgi:alpha-glucosidase